MERQFVVGHGHPAFERAGQDGEVRRLRVVAAPALASRADGIDEMAQLRRRALAPVADDPRVLLAAIAINLLVVLVIVEITQDPACQP